MFKFYKTNCLTSNIEKQRPSNRTQPLDLNFVNKHSRKRKLIVTVEEHSVIGGLASAISEANSNLEDRSKQLSISLPDEYFKGGEYLDLLARYNLNSEGIANTIIKNYKQ